MSGIFTCGHCGGAMGYRYCSHKNVNRGTGEERPGRKRYAYFDCVIDRKRAVSSCPVRTVSYDYFVGILEQHLEKALAASLELAKHAAAKADLDLHGILAALGHPGSLFPGLDPYSRRALIRARPTATLKSEYAFLAAISCATCAFSIRPLTSRSTSWDWA